MINVIINLNTHINIYIYNFSYLGEEVNGVELPDKTTLKYRLNGHLQFWLTFIGMAHFYPKIINVNDIYSISGFSALKLTLIYDNYIQLIFISCIGALILSIFLYIYSFIGNKILAKGGNTGNHVYDFFIGMMYIYIYIYKYKYI
jgi:delta14-sterol reductase